jgi:hypothetical protein
MHSDILHILHIRNAPNIRAAPLDFLKTLFWLQGYSKRLRVICSEREKQSKSPSGAQICNETAALWLCTIVSQLYCLSNDIWITQRYCNGATTVLLSFSWLIIVVFLLHSTEIVRFLQWLAVILLPVLPFDTRALHLQLVREPFKKYKSCNSLNITCDSNCTLIAAFK